MSAKISTDRALLARLLRQARPYRLHILGILLLGLLATPLALLMPIPVKIVVDSVLGSEPVPAFIGVLLPDGVIGSSFWLLVAAATLQVIFVLLNQMQTLGSYVLSTYTGEKLTLSLRARLFRHVQRLSFSFHDMRGTADTLYRVQYDASSITQLIVQGAIPLTASVVTAVSIVYVTLRINWQLALVAMTVAPVLYLLSRAYRHHMRHRYRQVRELESNALDVIQEVLNALRVVKAFGGEDRERDRFLRRSNEGVEARVTISFAEGALGLLVNVGTALGTAAVLFLGVLQIQNGTLTLGELLVVIAYLTQLYGPMKTISQKTARLQSALAGAQRTFELLDEAPDVAERSNARPVQRARGAVAFENVAFAYQPDIQVVRDLSFQVAPGTRVGLAGRSGAGKTTMMSLLTRFYDPVSGRILLDGVDLRDYKIEDLRNQFAIVLQEPVLFSTTIAENISYARPGARHDEIEQAAKAAEIHDLILTLPQGYETDVGERGLRLSGGERQRVALARAFLKDAPLLILDEPTSSVDVRTEEYIVEAMERLMVGRTTFIIAHRLSTLENCDLVLVLDRGQLITTTADASAIKKVLSDIPDMAVPDEMYS